MIRLTRHATEAMEVRNIPLEWVERTLRLVVGQLNLRVSLLSQRTIFWFLAWFASKGIQDDSVRDINCAAV